MAAQQEPLIRPYTRTPKQDRVLNPDELAKRLEAFAMLHDSPVKNKPQRRQSNAAYVPRNAGRAFQNTTTIRPETTKEAKRKTLPPGGFTWGGVDTPQDPEEGFSCAQLAYAHNQLQAYSDELRAKKSSRVLNVDDDDGDVDEEEVKEDPEAYKAIPRRPADRPNWAQGSDDEEEITGTDRFKNGAARMLNLSRTRDRERDREQEAVRRRSSNLDFTLKQLTRPEPITRRSSHGDLPSRKPSLYEQEEPTEEDIMNYVKSLPRRQTPSNNRVSIHGTAQDAAVDAAKRVRAQASSNDIAHKPARPRSMLFDNDVLGSLRLIRSTSKTPVQSPNASKSKDSLSLQSQTSRSILGRNSEEDELTRAREREEKALRRRTIQPDFSPSKLDKRSSWLDFRNSFRGVEPFTIPDRTKPDLRIDTTSTGPLPTSSAHETSRSDDLNSAPGMDAFYDSGTHTTQMSQGSGLSPISPIQPPISARASPRPQEHATSPLSRAPPKTMLVVQAAKKLHDEEVERKRRELREIRQQEQEEKARKRQSYSIPEDGPAKSTFIPPLRPLSTISLGRGGYSSVTNVEPPPRPFTTTGTKADISPARVTSPPPRPATTTGTKVVKPSTTSDLPTPLALREPTKPAAPLKSAMKTTEVPPKKEKKTGGLRKWFSKLFGSDRK